MQFDSVSSLSPSFNSYSNTRLVDIAARVVDEFNPDEFSDEFYFETQENPEFVEKEARTGDLPEEDSNEDEEFEFAFVARDSESFSPISADEIFQNGQIRPVYPVFNKDLLLEHLEFRNENIQNGVVNRGSVKAPAIRRPLRKLFIEERETTMTSRTTSSSSSESDELEGVAADTYCVWRPNEAAEVRCKKSSSAGSNSKRWKFKDLMNRSHSDGGNVFFSRTNGDSKKENGKVKSSAETAVVYNRDGGEKRRSYLPYKQDLVGFFGNVNGLSKNLHPF